MPAGYLHSLCADRARAISGVTPALRDVMILGAQGPDPLFTLGIFPLRPSSKPSRLGNLLHSYRTGAFLRALCRRAKAGGSIERAYALGFLTHYALDSTIHPYVYSQSNRPDGRYSSTLHMALEKSWDALYYRQTHERGTPVSMPGAAETRNMWPTIAAHWAGAIGDVFPEEGVTSATIAEALGCTVKANGLTHSPRGVKYRIVWLLERVIGKPGLGTSQMTPTKPMAGDIVNAAHRTWRSPFGEASPERTEGLAELYEAATVRAGALLTAANQYFDGDIDEYALGNTIGNLGYDSGLESKP